MEILQVLRTGPRPPGSGVKPTTKHNEEYLGLPPSVYAYLGRSSDQFGQNGFAVPLRGVAGDVSPFDTGGLVKHIAPVREWDQGRKRRFLQEYTWGDGSLSRLLKKYPSARLLEYLNGDPPNAVGPHEFWSKTEAPIWDPALNQWQAWTWEIRSEHFPVGDNLVKWTCPTDLYEQIQDFAEREPEEVEFFVNLNERYVPGGVSQLLRECRSHQELP